MAKRTIKKSSSSRRTEFAASIVRAAGSGALHDHTYQLKSTEANDLSDFEDSSWVFLPPTTPEVLLTTPGSARTTPECDQSRPDVHPGTPEQQRSTPECDRATRKRLSTTPIRPRNSISACSETSECGRNHRELRDDVLLKIFSHSNERTLGRLAQSCRRFNKLVDNPELWECRYKSVFEYDLPLIPGPNRRDVYFVEEEEEENIDLLWDLMAGLVDEPDDEFPGIRIETQILKKPKLNRTESIPFRGVSYVGYGEPLYGMPGWLSADGYSRHAHPEPESDPSTPDRVQPSRNIWRESFRRLSHAVHVLPNHESKTEGSGRTTKYFDNLEDAVKFCLSSTQRPDCIPLILVHPGVYRIDTQLVQRPIMILGCGPGRNPAMHTTLINNSFIFRETSEQSYLGYLTLISGDDFNGRRAGTSECIRIVDKAKPVIDRCRIRSLSSKGAAIVVEDEADPIIQNCDITDCECTGILVRQSAGGVYKENRILRNSVGIRLEEEAHPLLSRNTVRDCGIAAGVFFSSAEDGCFLVEEYKLD